MKTPRLRFQEFTAPTFRCPSCGQAVRSPSVEDKPGGAFRAHPATEHSTPAEVKRFTVRRN